MEEHKSLAVSKDNNFQVRRVGRCSQGTRESEALVPESRIDFLNKFRIGMCGLAVAESDRVEVQSTRRLHVEHSDKNRICIMAYAVESWTRW